MYMVARAVYVSDKTNSLFFIFKNKILIYQQLSIVEVAAVAGMDVLVVCIKRK